MSAAMMRLGPDGPQPRRGLALTASLALHAAFAAFILLLVEREIPEPPLEISIFEGPDGPASPPPGETSAAPGPIGPLLEIAKPLQAPKAPRVIVQPSQAPLEASMVVQPVPPERPMQEQGLPADVESAVRLHAVSTEEAVPNDGMLGAAAGGAGSGHGGFSFSAEGAGGSGRSYASIWEGTQRYLAGLRSAYDAGLRTHPGLRGTIVVRYEILPSGAVGSVAVVSSQLRDTSLEESVLRQIRGWRYPPEPSGTVVVTWPFSFLTPS